MPVWWVMMNVDDNTPRWIEYKKRGVIQPKGYFSPYDEVNNYTNYTYVATVYETATKRIRILTQRQNGVWIFRGLYEMYLNEYNPWIQCLTRSIHPLSIN